MRMLLPLVGLVVIALLGCGTSSGSLFDTVIDADQSEAEEGTKPEEEDLFVIRSRPSGAEIYIGNRYIGQSPVRLPDHPTGRYKIGARKEGYQSTEEWVTYSGGEDSVTLTLEPITGYLDVETAPPDAVVLLGSEELTTGLSEVPIGSYRLVVSAFGYTSQESAVTILENRTSSVHLVLEPADFEVSDVSVSRSVFNPANPGLTGKSVLHFQVSTYGTGTALVTDNNGTQLWREALERFTDWAQQVTWDGRDAAGHVMPDGEYLFVLEARAEDGSTPSIRHETSVRVDSSLIIRFRTLSSGVSGLLYAPTPEVLPEGSVQLASIIQTHIESDAYRAPVSIGLRVGLRADTEINASVAVLLENVEPLPYSLSVAGKHRLLQTGGNVAGGLSAFARLTYQHGTGTDTLGNFTGLSAGLPASLRVGRAMLVVSPELVVSPWRVTYDATFNDDPGLYAWLYTRTGILYDLSSASFGVSLTARTQPFGYGFGIDLPLQTAFEANVVIPGTQLFITAAVSGEFDAWDNYYLMGGVGLGILE